MNEIASRTRQLRSVLRVNAALTGSTGFLLAALVGRVDAILGTGRPEIVRLVGIALVVFAVDVALVARASEPRLRVGGTAILVADVAWVAASVLTITAGWFAPLGAAVVAVVALVVGGLAGAEWSSLRNLGSEVPTGVAVER